MSWSKVLYSNTLRRNFHGASVHHAERFPYGLVFRRSYEKINTMIGSGWQPLRSSRFYSVAVSTTVPHTRESESDKANAVSGPVVLSGTTPHNLACVPTHGNNGSWGT